MAILPANSIKTIAIVGLGTIGAAWSAWFLARGFTVRGTDPSADQEKLARQYIRSAWPALAELNLTRGSNFEDAIARFSFHAEPEAAAEGADFVQENAPERLELKIELLKRIDRALPADRVIASSTSGFGVSKLCVGMENLRRLVVGHPFNPPHLIPLVEVVGGDATDPAAIASAMEFYELTGKKPVHIRKEVAGHLANRLQAALWREAVHLVATGVASVEDVDRAVAYGPGLRWAFMGPHLTFHLAGGPGGMKHFIDHLGPPMQSWWDTLGSPTLTSETSRAVVSGVDAEVGTRSYEDMVSDRDRKLIRVMKAVALD